MHEAVYWSMFQKAHSFGHFLGPFPPCEDMLDPISIFMVHSQGGSFFGSLLGKIPKKCPYLTFSFWYLNAIKHWTAVLNKQSPDEKVNNAFVPFANSIATRSCTSNGLLIVRRTIKKVYKRYKIEKKRELTSHYWLYDAHYWPEKSSSNRFCYIWRYTALDMVDGAYNCREICWFFIWNIIAERIADFSSEKYATNLFLLRVTPKKGHAYFFCGGI